MQQFDPCFPEVLHGIFGTGHFPPGIQPRGPAAVAEGKAQGATPHHNSGAVITRC